MLGLRSSILSGIADPNVALLLVVVGILGIYVEFSAPGSVLPGVLGVMAVLLGLKGFSMLPIGWPGALLASVGLALVILEARTATRGILGAAGAIALFFGARLLRISSGMALVTIIPFSLITTFLLSVAARARRNKAVRLR